MSIRIGCEILLSYYLSPNIVMDIKVKWKTVLSLHT